MGKRWWIVYILCIHYKGRLVAQDRRRRKDFAHTYFSSVCAEVMNAQSLTGVVTKNNVKEACKKVLQGDEATVSLRNYIVSCSKNTLEHDEPPICPGFELGQSFVGTAYCKHCGLPRDLHNAAIAFDKSHV